MPEAAPPLHLTLGGKLLDSTALLQAMPELAWLTDRQGQLVACNAKAARAFGVPPDAGLAQTALAALPEVLLARLAQHDRDALQRAEAVEYEAWLPLAENQGGSHHIVKSPLRDAQGTVIGLLGCARKVPPGDATRRDAQALARLGSWRLDLQTGEIEASDEAFDIFKIGQNFRLTVKSVLSLIDANDRQRVLGAWRAATGSGQPGEIEYRLAGEAPQRWLRSRWLEHLDPQGLPTAIIGTLEDVTARHIAEDQLSKLSLAIEQSPHSIVITNAQGDIEYVNDSFSRNTGYTREEALGGNPRLLNSGRTPRAVYDNLWQTLERGDVWQGEFINARKDGTIFEEWAIISPVRQPDGQLTHYLAIKENISAKKRDQEELERHRHHLEALVVERTMELSQAKEDAELANRAKSAFLANMSHEIRTPMNAIVGLTHLLRRDSRDAAQLARMAKIADAADHLMGIINDVLDISKIEAGKLQLESVAFSLEATLQNVISLVAENAQQKGLSISLHLAPELPTRLVGDAMRMRQILLNFLSNAVKFSESGAIVLEADVLRREGDDWLVRCTVRDQGIGIRPEIQARLFNPFEQADTSTTRRHGGTGLGLAISRRLAESMGGEIGASSEVGKGSTFWFTARLGATQSTDAGGAEIRGHTALHWHGNARILLAEDNLTNEEVATGLLEEAGLAVDVARNGQEAIDLARAQQYDLVLMDMLMPLVDGLEATRQIRRLPGWSDIPILAMTASAFEEDRASCLAAGMNDHVPKPVDPQCLEAALTRWLPAHHTATLPSLSGPLSEADVTHPLQETLSTLPGLDVEVGLRAVRGNLPRYLELLARFVHGHAGDFNAIREQLRQANPLEAIRLAHSLKGAAGTLGANGLQTAALALEKALRAEEEHPVIEPLIVECVRVHALLNDALPPPQIPAAATADHETQPLPAIHLPTLISYLKDGDVRTQALARHHQQALRNLLGKQYPAFENSVLDFDFEVALALLNAACTSLAPDSAVQPPLPSEDKP